MQDLAHFKDDLRMEFLSRKLCFNGYVSLQ